MVTSSQSPPLAAQVEAGVAVLLQKSSSSDSSDLWDDLLFAHPLCPLALSFQHCLLSQADTHCWQSPTLVASSRLICLRLAEWLCKYMGNTKKGHSMPDSQVILLYLAVILKHAGVSRDLVLQEKMKVVMDMRAELCWQAFADYPQQQRQVLIQTPFTVDFLP